MWIARCNSKKRLEFIKANHLSGKSQVIVSKLLNPENEYSLDVLNGYIIGKVTTKKWNTEEWSNRIDLQKFHLSCRLSPTPPQSLSKPNQDVATLLVRNPTI